jgi:hypothetical protein
MPIRFHPLRAGSLECRPDKKRKRRKPKKGKKRKQADPTPTPLHGGLPGLGKRR